MQIVYQSLYFHCDTFSLLTGLKDGSLAIYDTQRHTSHNSESVYPKIVNIHAPASFLQSARRSKLSMIVCTQWNPIDTGSFITVSSDKTLRLWDTNAQQCIDVIKMPEPITWAAISSYAVEHNLIAVSLSQCGDRQAALIDPLVGAPTLNIRGGHTQPHLSKIIWSLRNSFIITTSGQDGRVLFWDIRMPVKPISSLDNTEMLWKYSYSPNALAHNGPVLSMAYSRDGLHLFTWGGTGLRSTATLRMWSIDVNGNACPVTSKANHSHEVGKTNFSPSVQQLRTINFGTFNNVEDVDQTISIPSSSNHRNMQLPGSSNDECGSTSLLSSVRMAVAAAYYPSTAWGASASFLFVPVGLSLLVTPASSDENIYPCIVKRHFDKIRACVWNRRQHELYTAGMDNNLNIWPLFPTVDEKEIIPNE